MLPESAEQVTAKPYPPVMSRQSFADWIGESDGVVRGWVERGEIETIKIGRKRLINVLAFVQMVEEQTP